MDGFSTEKSPPKNKHPKIKSRNESGGRLFDRKVSPKKQTPKNQKRLLIVSAFDWDGMGGNIGGLSVYVLALMIMYYPLVDWQWIESELPVTHKVAPKQSIFKQYATGISRGIERHKQP